MSSQQCAICLDSGAVSPNFAFGVARVDWLRALSAASKRTTGELEGETQMRAFIRLSFIAGLLITGGTVAHAGADAASDVAVWRWHVTNILRAQQNRPSQASPFIQRRGPYLADRSLAPMGDRLHR
jgi:hypothetical protein